MTEGITCYERDEELCEDQMCLRTGCSLRNKRLADDRLAQIDYSIDLMRIIEDLCHNRPIREPKTTARYHYDMAVAVRLAASPSGGAVREALEEVLAATKRHTLEVGFNHSHPTAKELQSRLNYIEQIATAAIDALVPADGVREALELAYGLLWVVGCDRATLGGNALYLARKALLEQLDKAGQERGITAARKTLNDEDAASGARYRVCCPADFYTLPRTGSWTSDASIGGDASGSLAALRDDGDSEGAASADGLIGEQQCGNTTASSMSAAMSSDQLTSIRSSSTLTAHVTELPENVRIPLNSLQADLGYLIGRVIADGSCGPMIQQSIAGRLNQIEEAVKDNSAAIDALVPADGVGEALARVTVDLISAAAKDEDPLEWESVKQAYAALSIPINEPAAIAALAQTEGGKSLTSSDGRAMNPLPSGESDLSVTTGCRPSEATPAPATAFVCPACGTRGTTDGKNSTVRQPAPADDAVVAWQRRLKKHVGDEWSDWHPCSKEQAEYALANGYPRDYENYLWAEVRPLFTHPAKAVDVEVVAAIKEAIDCITDLGSGKGGWAWEEVIQRLALLTGNASSETEGAAHD